MHKDFERYINNILKILRNTQIIVGLNGVIAIVFTIFFYTLFKNDYTFIKIPIMFIVIICVFLVVIHFVIFSNRIKQFKWILKNYSTDQLKCQELLNKYKGRKEPQTYSKYFASIVKASEILKTD